MWLLETNTRHAITQAEASGFIPTAEQQAVFTAASPGIMAIGGGKAVIDVKGVLTNSPNILAMIFGGGNTTYPDLISSIKAADNDESVSDIVLNIDSPGGHFNGLFEALSAIKAAKKPVTAQVSGMAASAAYAIGAQADKFVALSKAAMVGSIGVAADFTVSDNRVSIASTQAPKKRPDVRTEEGRAMVREELDALHNLFVDSIASGRGVDAKKVNSDFGQGAVLLAGEAVKRGMLDELIEEEGAQASGYDEYTASSVEPIAGATPPFKDYPIGEGSWDATAAIRRWRERTGSTEKPSAEYKNGFFWYDTEDADNFGAYKLPFVDVEGGQVKAIRRGVSAANAAMGGARGGVKIPAADRAKVQAHIDKYRDKIEKSTNALKGNNTKEVNRMDLETLKAQHPATFAEAVKLGVEQERDRVAAHLTMGEASGDMATAISAINDGSTMTANIHAKYMAASMKKNELGARAADNPDDIQPPAGDGAPTMADQVADFVCAGLGAGGEV